MPNVQGGITHCGSNGKRIIVLSLRIQQSNGQIMNACWYFLFQCAQGPLATPICVSRYVPFTDHTDNVLSKQATYHRCQGVAVMVSFRAT